MCARIYPSKEDISDMPYSESIVYDYLSKLSDTFTIFHSVRWVKRGNKWKSTWKENDYLILNRHLGILVLEIKGGDIEYTGSVFHQKNTNTGEINILDPKMKKDPLSQAIDGVYHYRRILDNIEAGLQERFPVEAAVWFPSVYITKSIDKFPLAYREISNAVLGCEAFDYKDSINLIYSFYESYKKVDISDDEYEKIINSIASDFRLITAPGIKRGELEHAFLKLTNEQMGLLDYISEQSIATIQGVAGTGKTLIAKEAARRFAKDNRKVLFLCFNRFLYKHLEETYPNNGVTYYNIHTFITKYIDEEVNLSTPENRAIALNKIDWELFDFDDIIIDEAQDFHNDEIIYFKDYVELKDGHFFVFYDKNQLLTTMEIPYWIKSSECKLLLTKNCRNTYEIALTSYNVLDLELSKKVIMINGEQTSVCFANKNNHLEKIYKILKYFTNDFYDYNINEIVILTLVREDNSIISGIHKLHGINITNYRTDSSVLFTTSKKFKGLESKVVIITDIDYRCFNDDEQKRNFYVACSRATQHLVLLIDNDKDSLDKISKSIGGSSLFAAKGKITMKLQATMNNYE